MEYVREKTIRLVAEDLRATRARLGITSGQAARRASLDTGLYRALERGRVPGSKHVLGKLVSVCRTLDVESVRIAYAVEIEQYVKMDLSSDPRSEPITAFVDSLEAEAADLKDIGCFVSPHTVLDLFDRIGFDATLASRNPVDKQLIEMLAGAVFTLCLDQDKDYYVKLVNDDPPDLEILVVDRGSRAFALTGLEITQHGKYSKSLFEVIGKKLAKRYQKGTILAVLVEGVERFEVAELEEFIRRNNAHGQRVVVIGGTGQAGRFLAVPLDEVSYPETGAVDWKEIEVDKGEGNTGFRGYKGVFCETSHLGRFLHMPLFVKEVGLSRSGGPYGKTAGERDRACPERKAR